MKRGDLVTVAMPGDFGKPRPALIVQSDHFDKTSTITLLPVSSARVDIPLLRVDIDPTARNNLRKPSQIHVDKVTSVRREKVGGVFGQIEDDQMLAVTRSLTLFLGFG